MAANSSAAMELNVLIKVLSEGTALPTLMSQVNQLSQALTNLQNQVNAAGQTGGIGKAAGETTAAIKDTTAAVSSINPQIDTLAAVAAKATNALKFLAGGFLGLKSVQFLKQLADTAARTEVLSTVLHIVAVNAGVTEERVDRVVSSIQRLGITAQSARESLTKFLQSGLKLEGADKLARAAQDLAVISGRDSSETFQRLIVNIQQLDTMGLRFMGIVVNRVEAERKYKNLHTEITGELTRREKQEALLAEVIDKARTLEGAYEAAMGNVGKQITSLRRYYEDLRGELGKHLLPAYSALVAELSLFLSKMQDQAVLSAMNTNWAETLGNAVRWLARQFFELTGFIIKHRQALELVIGAYIAFRAALMAEAAWAAVVKFWTWFVKDLDRAYAALVRVTSAVWSLTASLLGLTAAQRVGGGGQMMLPGFEKSTMDRLREFGVYLLTLFRLITDWSRYARIFAAGWALVKTAFAGLGLVFGGVVTVIVGLAAALLGLEAIAIRYTSLGPSMNGVFGQLWRIIKELGTFLSNVFLAAMKLMENIFKAIVGTVKAAIDELGLFMQLVEEIPGNPITAAVKSLDDLGKKFQWLGDQVQRANAWLVEFAGIGTERLARDLENTFDRIDAQKTKVADAEAKSVAALKTGIHQRILAAEAEYRAEKARLVELEDLRSVQSEALKKRDPERLGFILSSAERNRRQQEFETLMTAASEASGKMKTVPREGQMVPREYVEQIGALETLVKAYEATKDKTEEELAVLRNLTPKTDAERKTIAESVQLALQRTEDARKTAMDKASEVLPSVGAPGTVEKFVEQIRLLRPSAGAEERRLLGVLEEEGQIKASEFMTPVQRERLARQKATFEANRAIIQAGLDAELKQYKSAAEQQEALDREAMEQRSLSREEFHARQMVRARGEFEREAAVAAAAVDTARGGRRFARTDVERKQVEKGVLEAEDRARQVSQQFVTKSIGLNTAARQDLENYRKQIEEIRLQTAATYGMEAAQEAVIRNKYAERLKQQNVVVNSEEEAIILAEMQVELDKNRQDGIERRLQLSLEELRVKERELNLSKAILEVAKERVNIAEKEGFISQQDAMKIRNSQVQQDIKAEQERLSGLMSQREAQMTALADAEVAVRESQAKRLSALGGEDAKRANEEELRGRLLALKAAQDAVAGLNVEIVKSEGLLDTLFTKTESYGKQLRQTFQESLSTMISDLAMQTKSLADTFENFGKAIQGKIVGAISTNMAQKITTVIADIGRKKDPKTGKVIDPESPTLFDRIFKGLGLGTPPDGSKDRPFHVTVTNPQAFVTGEGVNLSKLLPPWMLEGKLKLETGPLLEQLLTSTVNIGQGGAGSAAAGILNSGDMGSMFGAFVQKMFAKSHPNVTTSTVFKAAGGLITGPGTGTSDSIPAWVSSGEHIMPADKTAKWLPLLEGIRTGSLLPHFALGGVVALQSIANPSIIPRRYASGGVVISDGGASAVTPGGGGAGNMVVSLHPDALNMSLREWLEQEVTRQHGRR